MRKPFRTIMRVLRRMPRGYLFLFGVAANLIFILPLVFWMVMPCLEIHQEIRVAKGRLLGEQAEQDGQRIELRRIKTEISELARRRKEGKKVAHSLTVSNQGFLILEGLAKKTNVRVVSFERDREGGDPRVGATINRTTLEGSFLNILTMFELMASEQTGLKVTDMSITPHGDSSDSVSLMMSLQMVDLASAGASEGCKMESTAHSPK